MWSVIILGLIKMLLKTVSFDQFAEYLMSEEHNLKNTNTKTPYNMELPQSGKRGGLLPRSSHAALSWQMEMLPLKDPQGRAAPNYGVYICIYGFHNPAHKAEDVVRAKGEDNAIHVRVHHSACRRRLDAGYNAACTMCRIFVL